MAVCSGTGLLGCRRTSKIPLITAKRERLGLRDASVVSLTRRNADICRLADDGGCSRVTLHRYDFRPKTSRYLRCVPCGRLS